ncbi:E3 ubiquitin-ligase DZIP3 isoform X2 [Micractinium conductrix]|uniref:E3 ubiquitin-ligase DZIP3 isoform X2 n=1 Tax=Micractinium conductrix TaxID=554055 RepID=A0A2P6VRL1_9CHLO|nr:E3 ubiquitin-ligase DZIP3 isoform X2 [Micractinium conductrix]|eukprot:PSC76729.1 E3 ubiquitin-ligase DZIP3 isoform X2 [Micractinium conductrix]
MAALALFDEPSGSSAAAGPPPPLPTGAAWPTLSIVTPEGLQQHAVQPGLEGGVDSRDPSRLTMSKRRACEE